MKNKITAIELTHDDMAEEVIEKVNKALKEKGSSLQFVDDEKDHDGWIVYELKEVKA